MNNYVLFITVIVVCLICWPAPLTDGLPVQPAVLVMDRPSRIAIVQFAAEEPTPPWIPKVPQLARYLPAPLDAPPDNNVPRKLRESALPTRLVSAEWREKLRRQESQPNNMTAIDVHI